MKRIAVVSSKADVLELLEKELDSILKGRVEFVRYLVRDKEVKCEADIVVLSGGAVAKYVSNSINHSVPILTPRRTLTMKGWNKMRSIPSKSSVLVVNDTKETAEETVNLLKEFGLQMKFFPYWPECKKVPRCEYVVTPGESRYVPYKFKKVIDIGNRVFEPSTILEILFRLEIFKWEDLQKLSEYSKTIKSTQPALQKFLFDMAAVRLELETVLSMASQGVMAFSASDGKIIFFNDFAQKYTGLRAEDVMSKDAKHVLKKFGVENPTKELHNDIVEINGIEMVLNSRITPLGTMILSFYPVDLHREIERKRVVRAKKSGMIAHAKFDDIVGGEKMKKVIQLAKKMALSDAPILLEGESGTGKELFAQAIHNYSKRKGPFVPINCASLSEELLESELFGYVEGAFTGAKRGGKIGLFELANGGTIFLDEISELPLQLQSKLLRVLQEKEIIRVGGIQLIPIDVRVITATNGNLFEMVKEGKFRMDLFYRISTFQLRLPPLRERTQDMEMLLKYFISKRGYKITIPDNVISLLKKYEWPGNVREVENFVDYVGNLFSGEIGVNELPPYLFKRFFISSLSQEEKKVLLFLFKVKKSGRERISKACELNERKTREILDKLRRSGYIEVKRGRNGTHITELGSNLFPEITNYYL